MKKKEYAIVDIETKVKLKDEFINELPVPVISAMPLKNHKEYIYFSTLSIFSNNEKAPKKYTINDEISGNICFYSTLKLWIIFAICSAVTF